MALGLQQTDKVDTGNQAVASSAIGAFMTSSIKQGAVLSLLYVMENLFNYKTTNFVATDTVNFYNDQANQLIMKSVGGAAGGLLTVVGAGLGAYKEYQSNQLLAGDQKEIETMGSYLEEAEKAGSETSHVLSTSESTGFDTEKMAEAQKARMAKLTRETNFTQHGLDDQIDIYGPNKTDKRIIQLSDKDEAEALAGHLRTEIGKKRDALNAERNKNNRDGDNLNMVVRSAGVVIDSALQGGSAYYMQKAGEDDSARSVGQSALATIQPAMNEMMSQAVEAFRAAAQASEINVELARGDNLQNG
ncbi:hypothetical protein [Simkania sp.]|uniref:hypothetical protein n=1 Tax=Simkania sp. TaxID=34094 RepID=UPI003B52BC19